MNRALATEVDDGQDITSLYSPRFSSRMVCLYIGADLSNEFTI